jgi:hypothetical protein
MSMSSSMWTVSVLLVLSGACPSDRSGRGSPQSAPKHQVESESGPCIDLPDGTSNRHLVPEREPSDTQYDAMVRRVLARSFLPEVSIRMLCLPSFETEWATGLRNTDNGTVAFFERAKDSVWSTRHFELERSGQIRAYDSNGRELSMAERYPKGGPRLETIAVEYLEVHVDRETTDLLREVWSSALADTRIPDPGDGDLGLDGVSYYFSKGPQTALGRAWSPEKDSAMAALVAVSNRLADLARTDGEGRSAALVALRVAAHTFQKLRAEVGRRPTRRCSGPAPRLRSEAGR